MISSMVVLTKIQHFPVHIGKSTLKTECGLGENFMFGENWTATYFNSTDLSGPVVYSELLPNGININWGFGAPDYAVQPDNFSARFTSVQHFDAAIHEFVLSSDAGIRFYINNILIL